MVMDTDNRASVGIALRATTNPAAWRIACRRFAAVGLAPGLDFVGRRKASVSNPSGFAMQPDTKSGLRRTRKRPRGLLRPLRGSLRSATPTFLAGASRGLHERKERRWEGRRILPPSLVLCPEFEEFENRTQKTKELSSSHLLFVYFRVPRRRRFVSRRGEEARKGGGDVPTPARRSLKPGGGKSSPDRQRRSFAAPGFVVARSAVSSTNVKEFKS